MTDPYVCCCRRRHGRGAWSAARPMPSRLARRARRPRTALKASFKEARPGEARSPRPGRDAAAVQRLRRQGAAEGRRGAHRGSRTWRRSNTRPTASSSATGRTARRSRRKAAASSTPTIPKGRSAAIAMRATSSPRRRCPTARSARRFYRFGKMRGYTEETRKYAYGKVYNPEAYAACTQHAALRPQRDPLRGSRSRMSSRCSWTRLRRSTSDGARLRLGRAPGRRGARDTA